MNGGGGRGRHRTLVGALNRRTRSLGRRPLCHSFAQRWPWTHPLSKSHHVGRRAQPVERRLRLQHQIPAPHQLPELEEAQDLNSVAEV